MRFRRLFQQLDLIVDPEVVTVIKLDVVVLIDSALDTFASQGRIGMSARGGPVGMGVAVAAAAGVGFEQGPSFG